MPASFAPSAAPPNALLMWTDGRAIYIELPTKPNLPPCIITYRLSEGGLSKALSLLRAHADTSGNPMVSLPPVRAKKTLVGTITQHAFAESLLRKKGLIK